ncbi:unnamed protein product [Brassica oleracea var. botrytis]|uniref:(rape) hypothetical protein n=1 Tax=Brassica napus TaxID=3708 RepID=A0A816JV60_BRANA|nr:unnamed protein product [Brassica napus]
MTCFYSQISALLLLCPCTDNRFHQSTYQDTTLEPFCMYMS